MPSDVIQKLAGSDLDPAPDTILGGNGFMHATLPECIYREAKVMMIGGGAEEIMKDLAARQLGW